MADIHVEESARAGKAAALALAELSLEIRNNALLAMADAVETRRAEILAENNRDLAIADKLVQEGKITAASAKRLQLGGSKLDGVVEGLRSVASQPDPLGRTLLATELDVRLNLYRVSCPIGLIAMIFESRPDALPQIASLCLKSGNAVILKGGSEALHSNRILAKVLDEAARSVDGVPEGWITLLKTREEVARILGLDDLVDLLIPRGSNEFVRYIMDNTKIPVTGHRDGVCHTYVHAGADREKAIRIAVDAKCQYPAVCNAMETLLFDRRAAERMMPEVLGALLENGVELRVDAETKSVLEKAEGAKELLAACLDATEEDWKTEYLDLVLSVRVVENLQEAADHINRYGSHHTDAIVTEDTDAADRFLRKVDSSSVLHNASTRFADGFRYGLGAEVGISTEKIHSRGPVGLEGLTIYKYKLKGDGQIVADYTGPEGRKFTHKPMAID